MCHQRAIKIVRPNLKDAHSKGLGKERSGGGIMDWRWVSFHTNWTMHPCDQGHLFEKNGYHKNGGPTWSNRVINHQHRISHAKHNILMVNFSLESSTWLFLPYQHCVTYVTSPKAQCRSTFPKYNPFNHLSPSHWVGAIVFKIGIV